MTRTLCLLLFLGTGGCAGVDAGAPTAPAAPTERRAAPDAVSPAGLPTPPLTVPAASAPAEQSPLTAVTARLVPVGPALAEDGSGQAQHPQAVAIELVSDGWPGEAMEPSLEVQGRRFVHYTHPSPVGLRFVVASADLVPAGAVATVRYGERIVAELTLPQLETP